MFWLISIIEHVIVIVALYKFYLVVKRKGLKDVVVGSAINAIQSTSLGKGVIGGELDKAIQDIKDLVVEEDKHLEGIEVFNTIPKEPLPQEKIKKILTEMRELETAYNSGKAFGGIYSDLHEHHDFLIECGDMYADSNALYPFLFYGVKKCENEFVRMTLNLLEAPSTGVGVMTTGGTESIVMACKAYREWGKAKGITEPEMIVPVSSHAAFCKGAYYLGMKFVVVPVDDDFRVSVSAIENAITPNTVMIVANSPNYPNGIIDDIERIGEIAYKNGIPFHVDACLGAYILPFLDRLGINKKLWNFKVRGVTSISADLHKYGHGLKGTSTICYRSEEYRKHQFFTTAHWSGGLYASPSFTGSRPGTAIAAAWACLLNLGEKGYLDIAQGINENFTKLVDGINSIPELEVVGNPDACCIGFNTSSYNVLLLADLMDKKYGWKVINRMQKPTILQIQVGLRSDWNIDEFLENLRECSAELKSGTIVEGGQAAVYGLAGSIPAETGLVDQILTNFLSSVYK